MAPARDNGKRLAGLVLSQVRSELAKDELDVAGPTFSVDVNFLPRRKRGEIRR